MKELSIEEKARRYDEAIERGSRLWESDTITRESYEYIFPELKESEDERIIKSFIRLLKAFYDVNFPTPEGFERKDMIAWLEKQGAELSVYQNVLYKIATILSQHEDKEDSPLEQIRSIVVDGLLSAMDIEKQGNKDMSISEATKQKLEDNLNKALEKETPESYNEFLEKQDEQKPEEIVNLHDYLYGEQKPEWSEVDERMLQNILECLKNGWRKLPTDIIKYESWLKSLKPQTTWKPSDEQMKVLEFFIPYVTKCSVVLQKSKDTLLSLLSDLKKLREK